jgi:hypothetical protein
MIVVFINRQAAMFLVAAFSLFFVGLLLLGWLLYSSINHKFSRVCELVEAEETMLEKQQESKPPKGHLFLVDGEKPE